MAQWNDAHRLAHASRFEQLYADSVLYYGKKQSRDACIASKRRFMTKFPDFMQTIASPVQLESMGSEMRATFAKSVTSDGKTQRYPSYLGLVESKEGWKIAVEGDEVTDATLKKRMGQALAKSGAVTGDWDGDGTAETVRLVPPKFPNTGREEDFGECVGECSCELTFEGRPSIVLQNCIGGLPVNEGNLDGHPGDELGLLPEWWTSCWHGYHVFGLREGQWISIVDSISTHCSQWDDGVDAIEQDANRPGHVLVRSTDMSDFSVKTHSVKVR